MVRGLAGRASPSSQQHDHDSSPHEAIEEPKGRTRNQRRRDARRRFGATGGAESEPDGVVASSVGAMTEPPVVERAAGIMEPKASGIEHEAVKEPMMKESLPMVEGRKEGAPGGVLQAPSCLRIPDLDCDETRSDPIMPASLDSSPTPSSPACMSPPHDGDEDGPDSTAGLCLPPHPPLPPSLSEGALLFPASIPPASAATQPLPSRPTAPPDGDDMVDPLASYLTFYDNLRDIILRHPSSSSHADGRHSETIIAKALPLITKAHTLVRWILPPDSPQLVVHLTRLHQLYQIVGAYEESYSCTKELLELQKAQHPEDCEALARAYLLVVDGAEEVGEANEYLDQALGCVMSCESDLKPEHCELLLTILERMGQLYIFFWSGRAFKTLVAVWGRVRGMPLDASTAKAAARALHTLAEIYQLQGNHKKAAERLRDAYEIQKESLQPHDPDRTLLLLESMGLTSASMGELSRAREQLEEALVLRLARESAPWNDAEGRAMLGLLAKLAWVYYWLGDDEKAAGLITASPAQIGPCKTPMMKLLHATLKNFLASMRERQGRLGDNKPLLNEILEVYERVFGRHHIRVADILRLKAIAAMGRRDYRISLELLRQASDVVMQNEPSNHPPALRIQLLKSLARKMAPLLADKALPLMQGMVSVQGRLYGPQDLSVADAMCQLTQTYESLGELDKAAGVLEEALAIFHGSKSACRQLSVWALRLASVNRRRGAIQSPIPYASQVNAFEKVIEALPPEMLTRELPFLADMARYREETCRDATPYHALIAAMTLKFVTTSGGTVAFDVLMKLVGVLALRKVWQTGNDMANELIKIVGKLKDKQKEECHRLASQQPPASCSLRMEAAVALANFQYLQGLMYSLRKARAAAVSLFSDALATLDKANQCGGYEEGRCRIALAVVYLEQGKTDLAREVLMAFWAFDKDIDISLDLGQVMPCVVLSHFRQATAFGHCGDRMKGISPFLKAFDSLFGLVRIMVDITRSTEEYNPAYSSACTILADLNPLYKAISGQHNKEEGMLQQEVDRLEKAVMRARSWTHLDPEALKVSLRRLAFQYEQLGEFELAKETYEKALTSNPASTCCGQELAALLERLADAYRQTGKPEEAIIKALEEAVGLWRQVSFRPMTMLGRHEEARWLPATILGSLSRLAREYKKRQDWIRVLEVSQEACVLAVEHVSRPDDQTYDKETLLRYYVDSSAMVIAAYRALDRLPELVPCLEGVIAFCQAHDTNGVFNLPVQLSELAQVQFSLPGQLDKAIDNLREAVALAKNSSDKVDSTALGRWLSLLGSALGRIRDGDAMERFAVLEEAAAINRSCLSHQDEAEAETLNALLCDLPTLADIYYDRQDYEKAVALWEEEADLKRRHGIETAKADSALATSRTRLAKAYEQLNRIEGALLAYQQAVHFARESGHFLPPDVYVSFGNLLHDQGRLEDALGILNDALAATRALGTADDNYDETQLLNKLGWLKRMLGDWQGAIQYYEEALAIRRERKMNQYSPSTLGAFANSCYRLAVVYGDMGEFKKALDMAHEAVNAALGVQTLTTFCSQDAISEAGCVGGAAMEGDLVVYMECLANANERLGRGKAAKKQYREAYEKWRRLWLDGWVD